MAASVKFSLKRKAAEPLAPTNSHAFEDEARKALRVNADDVEHLIAMDGRATVSANNSGAKGPLVIPLVKVNAWNSDLVKDSATAHTNAKLGVPAAAPNLSLSNAMPDLKPSQAAENAEETPVVMTESQMLDSKPETNPRGKWGLQIRNKKALASTTSLGESPASSTMMDVDSEDARTLEEKAIAQLLQESSQARPEIVPILQQNAVPGIQNLTDPKEKYLYDVSLRPDEATIQDFEDVPIEDFGIAMLRGMGYKEDESKKKEDFVFNKPRPNLLGLGAEPPKPPPSGSKDNKKSKGPWDRDNEKSSARSSKTVSAPDTSKSNPYAPEKRVKLLKDGINRGLVGVIISCKHKKDGIALKIALENKAEVRCWSEDVQLLQ
ncbi:DExH-box splicing factor binding site-domain-containing protein [Chytriomyces cf. hyalinus JEL632]|nr:DExH-box splicing factor binding site-domain-containing protein [Chytriomyces cf. hyalinus JEL632]